MSARIAAVIAANPAEVEAYRGGKTKLISFFVGQVMRATISLTIAESITVAHTLADDALVNATMFALTAPEAGGYESSFTVEGFDKEVSEKGYVLHFIELSVPVEIR